jgi:hypothetical protein
VEPSILLLLNASDLHQQQIKAITLGLAWLFFNILPNGFDISHLALDKTP